MPYENEGWDWSNAYISQGTSRIVSDHRKLWENHETDSPSRGPEKPAKHLDFELLTFRAIRE